VPSPSRSRSTSVFVLAAMLTMVSGCARAVLPSEKAYLADPIMQLDSDALEAASDAHIQSNREGASGGRGTRGGGCGCN
jgi:hypothetical protein